MSTCTAVPARFTGSLRISGRVMRGAGAARTYVRLLDRNGEFVGEVPTGKDGSFAFFAVPGEWIVRVIGASTDADVSVSLVDSDATALEITL